MTKIFLNFKVLLILGTIILVALVTVLIWQSSKNNQGVAPLPAPTSTIRPTVSSTFSPTPVQSLQIISIKPDQNLDKVFMPIQQIEIEFNLPIDPDSLNYVVNPSTGTNIRFKGASDRIMVLSPDLMWAKGITTITILKGASTANNIRMPSDFVYKINTDFPQVAPPDSPGL